MVASAIWAERVITLPPLNTLAAVTASSFILSVATAASASFCSVTEKSARLESAIAPGFMFTPSTLLGASGGESTELWLCGDTSGNGTSGQEQYQTLILQT